MLPFDSKQMLPSDPSEFAQPADIQNDVRASFQVVAVIAFFAGCAALFGLIANVF